MRKILLACVLGFVLGNAFSQNIAVNTTGAGAAATNLFEVTQASGANNTVGIFSKHTGAATNAYAIWAEVTGGTNKYAIVVPSGGGNVGIGTSTPLVPLHVIANASTSPLYLKSNSGFDAFSILPWAGVSYLSAGLYYNNGAWVHDAATTSNALLGIQPNAGVIWYNSNNSAPSWNVAAGVSQWDVNGYWKNLVQSTATGNSYFTGGNVGIGTATPAEHFNIVGIHGTTQMRLTLPAAANGLGTGDVNLQMWVSEPGVTWDAGGIGTNVFNNGGAPAGFGRPNTALGQAYIRFITNGGAMAFNTTNNAGTYYQTMYMTGGNVGIGLTNPAYNLEVNGTFGYGDGVAGSYRSRTESRADAGQIASQSGFYQTAAPAPSADWPTSTASATINFDASGNATNWWHLIDSRHSNSGNNYAMQLAGGFFDQRLYFRKTDNNAAQPWSEVMTTSSTGYIKNQTTLQASANYNISGSGNVQTSYKLQNVNVIMGTGTDVYANIRVLQNISTAAQDGMYINYASTGGAAADLKFYANGTSERMRILASNGNVGIGTAGPGTKLDISGGGGGTVDLRVNGRIQTGDAGGAGGIWLSNASDGFVGDNGANIGFWTSTVGWNAFQIIKASGNVGIGTATPACKLQVIGRIMTDNMNQTSDIRLKKNIVTIDNALTKVTSVRGVYFNWKDDAARKRDFDTTLQMGVIAQEIEKIFPELVHTDNEGYKSVEYSNMVAVLIEAIKEQQKQIDGLKTEIGLIKGQQKMNVDSKTGKIELKPAGK